MKSINTLLAIMVLALSATQLSCSVNDYCLNCGTGDGGTGSDDANDADMPQDDAPPDAGCIPTGPEECDDVDNDCNGLKDDGVVIGVGQPCNNQMGACQGGTNICVAGEMTCTKTPSPEICDFIDNNCNGPIDEGDPGGGGKCGTDMGECIAGTLRCESASGCNAAASCDPLVQGSNCCVKCKDFLDRRNVAETCNAKDDNCNGQIDDGITLGACTWAGATNAGECNIGTLSCVGGTPQCTGAVFPRFEICNGLDDDCDTGQPGGGTDESFNKNIDPQNCGMCGMVCAAPQKTCINSTIPSENGTTCTVNGDCAGNGTCSVNSTPCCGPACAPSKPNQANGTCNYECSVGFIDLNGTAADGCEYKCSPTGSEECDGIDNDCDGVVDEPAGLTTPVGLCLTQGVCAGSTPMCMGSQGWRCNYGTGFEPSGEVSCDGLNNDCDGNIDESHPEKYQTCFDNQPATPLPDNGVCRDQGVLQCNSADADGPLVCQRGENGAACTNATDDNGDGRVNDGCPPFGPNLTPETQCTDAIDDDGDGRVNDGCPASTLPSTQPGTEICNALDDDCDGSVDEPTAGVLPGQDWVSLANGVQMMKYEASRPDSTNASSGIVATTVCSRPSVLPWTNITYPQAQAACASVGGRLCTESEWHHACSVVPTPTTVPYTVAGAVIIEAEDYTGIAHATSGQTTRAWVHDYTTGFSGISAMEALPNTNGGTVASGNAVAQAPRLSYSLDVTQASASYHVWVKMYVTGLGGNNDLIHVQIDGGALSSGTLPAPTPCTMNSQCTFLTGGTCADLDANLVGDFCAGYRWVDAGTFNITAAAHTLNVYMGDDGVKIDKVALNTSATAPVDAPLSKGNIWAYGNGVNPNVASDTTCNGHERSAANDDILTTGSPLTSCFADNAGTNDVFDMSGNVKEWTAAQQPGVNPLRGGASNSTTIGTSCPLNFTVADDALLFPNIGFRCCK